MDNTMIDENENDEGKYHKRKRRRTNNRFESPQALWEECCEYFDWLEENPIYDTIVYQGEVTSSKPIKRVATLRGLYAYLGIVENTFTNYINREEYRDVCLAVKDLIWIDKYESAAANVVNAALIMRDLGMAEKAEITGANGQPLEITKVVREIVESKRKNTDS